MNELKRRRFLLVLESPNKIAAFAACLRGAGFSRFEVAATFGHIADNPDEFSPIGINGDFQETRRKFRIDDQALDTLLKGMERSDAVVIATDDDAEGHAIASDVAAMAPEGLALFRMRCNAIERETVLRALDAMEPFGERHQREAQPAITRRIIDRIVGAVTYDPAHGVCGGRVQSALLAAFRDRPQRVGLLRVFAPDAAGGPSFVATLPVTQFTHALDDATLEALRSLPKATVARRWRERAGVPVNFDDVICNASERLNWPVARTGAVLQSMFERGRISYPRVSTRALSESSRYRLDQVAKEKALRVFRADNVPLLAQASGAHEAIRLTPAGESLADWTKPLSVLEGEEGLLSLIGRASLLAGIVCVVEEADTTGFPEWARKLPFRRRVFDGLPWPEDEVNREALIPYKADRVIFEALVSEGLGRPSTRLAHVRKFMERALVDERFHLTGKGREWLESLPAALQDSKTNLEFENRMESAGSMDRGDYLNLLFLLLGRGEDIIQKLGAVLDVSKDEIETSILRRRSSAYFSRNEAGHSLNLESQT